MSRKLIIKNRRNNEEQLELTLEEFKAKFQMELKQAINEIINTITSNSKQTSFNPRINNSIEMMMPTIANTRNLGVR